MMFVTLEKKYHRRYLRGMWALVLILSTVLPMFQKEARAQFLPFEGRIINIEYNCLCALSIALDIEPRNPSRSGQQAYSYIFFYGPQLLEMVADWVGIDPPDSSDWFGLDIPIPRLYAQYMIWTTGSQQLLGNYIPGSFPCVAYSGTSCSIEGYGDGAIMNVGTNWF